MSVEKWLVDTVTMVESVVHLVELSSEDLSSLVTMNLTAVSRMETVS